MVNSKGKANDVKTKVNSRSLGVLLFGCAAMISCLQAANSNVSITAEGPSIYELKLSAPITTWDEAIPLGNGMLGGLLWGADNVINLSLDRGDLWDESVPPEIKEGDWNYANMKKLKEENWNEFMRRYDGPFNHSAPTKLPGGRLALTLSEDKKAKDFTLDMKKALGAVHFTDGSKLESFFSADKRVALILVDDDNVTAKFIRPYSLDQLNYSPAKFGTEDRISWMVQKASGGLVYATLTASKRVGKQTLIAVAITTNQEDATQSDPLVLARSRVSKALKAGYEKMLASHQDWWKKFWAISEVTIPDERLQRHYNLVKYFYGAASRPDAPSMPLQCVWTQDSGALPPWKGDYHHDLNTEMAYLAYHKAGLTDSGMSFINHMWDLLPEFRKFAKDFYDVDGAVVPVVMSLNGKPLGGWPQYCYHTGYGIWVGQSFYLHWKHTMDDTFLREKAYPWMDEIVSTIVKLLDEKDGKLYFQLSVSAEIFDAAPRAYLKPNSNQDLALLRWGFEAMAEMAEALGKQDDVKRWKVLRGKLDGLHIDKDHSLMFSSNEPFNEAHRHHAHAMAIHPFATLNIDGTDKDRQIIDATIKRMVKLGGNDPQGYGWCGFTYSWFSSMLARTGYPELALENLIYFERAFTVRNGFHVCGDMLGTGLTNYVWRSYTLEGNFGAMEAVHDMLLQSWPVDIAKDPTPVIRIFPAMPWKWHDASFTDLRAEGGFIVSAERQNNATTSFSVKAVIDGELRLRDNFGGVKPKFNRKVKKVGRDFVIKLKKGQTLTGKLAKPKNIPPQPKDSTEAEKRIRRIESLALAKDPERLAAKGLINGGFETGDLTGWWASGDVKVVDSAADVYEGSYVCRIDNRG
jgi:alpha-L-fucosidase 2